jgi:predicted RND superfamily exporter protein
MSNEMPGFARVLQNLIFGFRGLILVLIAVVTALMLYFAAQLKVDAGFKKQLPLEHEYMQTFQYYEEFGGANRLLVAVMAEDGDMFDAEYFATLEEITNRVFFIPGVDRASVRSIFTPNVRFVEIVEDGFAGGNVIPADFAPTQEMFERVRGNIVKSGEIGRLVSEDFGGAMVWANLLEEDPQTGEKLDYQAVAAELEKIRSEFENEAHSVHIIGFAKIVGDIANGARSVVTYFGFALLITALLLYWYTRSPKLSVLPLICSVTAVIWQLGFLKLLGFGIDPMNILTPFLVFAIGVSHGVQMITAFSVEKLVGGTSPDRCIELNRPLSEIHIRDSISAAKATLARLLAPGVIALLSDTIGFLTILFIKIRIIQELAITASVGVAVIILTNLILLPILLSFVNLKNEEGYRQRIYQKAGEHSVLWHNLAKFAKPGPAIIAVLLGAVLFGFGYWKSQEMQIGDSQAGVPELWPEARYNRDADLISSRFALGVDVVSVISETTSQACTENYEVMRRIDEMAWRIGNVEGVQKVITLPMVAKIINAGWNEGNINWRVLSRNNFVMRQALSNVDTATGLLNRDCSAMPIMVFTEDHRAETIRRVVDAVKTLRLEMNIEPENPIVVADASGEQSVTTGAADTEMATADSASENTPSESMAATVDETAMLTEAETCVAQTPEGENCLRFRLATGNVGVMAAVNEVVSAAQGPILFWVYAAIVVLCLITFRSISATLAIVLPLVLVSYLAYSLMVFLGIGLKVNTLPVVALGVGIGVDYGIYIYSRLSDFMREGMSLEDAYYRALRLTGRAVAFTAVTLAVGVGTWLFSALKFQADMGLLLSFMFLLNMVGAIVLLPALVLWLKRIIRI